MAHPEQPKTKRQMRDRFTPQVKAGLRLEERDLELLCDVFLHRLMLRSQIERLHFGSTSYCNVRLRQLFDHDLLDRYYLPLSLYGSQGIYSLGAAAITMVARKLDWEPDVVKSQANRHKTPQFLEHTLAINEARLALREALETSPTWELQEWRCEIQCHHEYEAAINGSAYRDVFKPDGFVRLRDKITGQNACFFLEMDMGHVSSRKFAEKLELHMRYLESGTFACRYEENAFYTLVITTGPGRLKNLKTLVEKQGSDLFCFARSEDIKKRGIIDEVWHFPFEDVTQLLL